MAVTTLGIRHHGVGSAKHVLNRLQELKPDFILIEGPPEITDILKYISSVELVPPVSIMVYNIDNPKLASFYPFTSFSPEWVAIKYAIDNNIPYKAIDMPAAVAFNQSILDQNKEEENEDNDEVFTLSSLKYSIDPMSSFAGAAGYNSSEEWWDYFFERYAHSDSAVHFEAIDLAMYEMRAAEMKNEDANEKREAYMREELRKVLNDMYTNVAVICGAWHGPAINKYNTTAKEDAKILKAIPKSKIKIATTWIPWTNERLSLYSGYGAGIYAPGWYEHLWNTHEDVEIKWLINVAKIFRSKEIDVSSAHIIEASRMAQSLAALRGKSSVTLNELNDATQSIICMGDSILLNYIKKELIVANRMGSVPNDIPKVPIQEDFEKIIKSLKLSLSSASKQYDLDLRNDNDLQRSILFHRLEIINVKWASRTFKRSKGTFREAWILQWSPEMMIDLIDKAYLGNTIELATTAFIVKELQDTNHIGVVANYFEKVLPAELMLLIDVLLAKIHELSSISADIADLMKAVPPLIDVARYGNVRKADLDIVKVIVDNLILKINIGIVNACYGLDEENSAEMFQQIYALNEALKLVDNPQLVEDWYFSLKIILDKDSIHPLIQGCVSRLLLDHSIIDNEQALTYLSFALSPGNDAMHAAFWLEGFLKGSAMILVYDNKLWNMLYQWVASLSKDEFDNLLPFLRRSFSKFEFGERRQIGERAKKGKMEDVNLNANDTSEMFDKEKGRKILPIVLKFFGVKS
jgi:hypothetical protein